MAKRLYFALLAFCAVILFPSNADASGKNRKTDVVWTAYDSFNQVFLDSAKYIYKTDTSFPQAVDRFNGAAAIWCQPTYWDMAMNAYQLANSNRERKRARRYKQLCRQIFEGNKSQYAGFDFDDNNENTGWFIYDDIMWWTITLARAYELFGTKEYLELSEQSFHRVWYGSERVGDTGSYDPQEGGMFWRWYPIQNPHPNKPGDGKMACINFPVVVAALTLYNNVSSRREEETGDAPLHLTKAQYLQRGKEVYEWGVKNLFDAETGAVADSRHGHGSPAWVTHVYNQATFIGASVLLYQATGEERYLDNAILAADYVINVMSTGGLLPWEDGIEQGIYTAIFAQYMSWLVYDCGQTQYLSFLQRNAQTGWEHRDRSRNICGGEYGKPLPEGATVDSYTASGIPALMLLFPPSGR